MFTKTKLGKWAVRGALVLTLGAIFIIYLGIALNLSTRAYTSKQADFLSYNYERSVVQAPLVMNLVMDETPEGEVQVQPANFTDWESHVRARLDARYEEDEGVSATVYELDFESSYHLTYPGPALTATVELVFPFPSNLETLHNVDFLVDGVAPPEARYTIRDIRWQTVMEAGDTHDIIINYRADGANSFTYALNQDRRFDTLDVQVTVNGVAGSTVPKSALPTTEMLGESESGAGERFVWAYEGLVPGRNIRLELPQRLGFAQRLAQLQDDFATLAGLAPFIVGLFLATLAGWFALADVHLRLEGYLLIGVAMTLFYPALTFLSGVLPLSLAAVISLIVACGLILTFLGLSVGWHRTWWRAGWLLVIFLGIFSLSIFTPWTMLLGTLGGVLLVGTFMALYARRPIAIPTDEIAVEEAPEAEAAPPPPAPVAPGAPGETHHCPRCARQMPRDFDFCPGCGYDMRPLRTCATCDHEQFVPTELTPAYCQHCGEPLT